MIVDRRIALDGVPLETPATVLTSLKGITVDGNPVAAAEAARLFRYHKPTGLLTAERDMKGRPTIYDKLPTDMPRAVPVGRLDLNTEGLLLMTTDGELKRRMELPSTGVPRSYRARAYGPVTQAQLEDLIDGVVIDGVRYGQIDANLERRTGTNVWIEMTLTEGKNREVRRVLEHLGLRVSRLIRTRYGPFMLDDLPPGQVDEVKQHELVEFLKSLGSMKAPPIDTSRAPAYTDAQMPLRKHWRIAPSKSAPRTATPRTVAARSATPRPIADVRKRSMEGRPKTGAVKSTDSVVTPRPPSTRPPKPKAGWAKAKPPKSRGPRK